MHSHAHTLSLSFTHVALSIVFAWRTFFVVGVQTLIQHLPPPFFLDYFTTSPRSPSNLLDHACWILLFVAIMKKKHICICIGVYRNLTEEKRTFFWIFDNTRASTNNQQRWLAGSKGSPVPVRFLIVPWPSPRRSPKNPTSHNSQLLRFAIVFPRKRVFGVIHTDKCFVFKSLFCFCSFVCKKKRV